MKTRNVSLLLVAALGALLSMAWAASGQPQRPPQREPSPLERLANYERYTTARQKFIELSQMGRVRDVQWSDDGVTVSFIAGKQRVIVDLATGGKVAKPLEEEGERNGQAPRGSRRPPGYPGRGRQRDAEDSPNGRWTAACREWNVVLTDNESQRTIDITTDGWRKFRYGKASWVYGEELDQRDAIWWSPDSSRFAFYQFDERDVPDHWLVTDWTDLHTKSEVEGYPKPGDANPVAGLILYDIESATKLRIDLGSDPEQYIYGVQFVADGEELIYFRTNRHQNRLDVIAANVHSGAPRLVVTELQDTWQDNRPYLHFLDDGRRFIWETQRNGWSNLELRDLDGQLLNSLSNAEYPIHHVERIDEKRGELWYTAFSDANPLNAQVHRVSLGGTNAVCLTNQPGNCTSVEIAPDGKWFIATYEAISKPATTVLYDREGAQIAVLAQPDESALRSAGVTAPELFSCTAADGETTLYGVLYKPMDFNPEMVYPLLVDVYGGPQSQEVPNRFQGSAECEFGYLIAKIDNRGTSNRGKAFESANYLKLGDVDLADQAAAVRQLINRPYIDATRVGIAGHSYGGYMAALAILKFPDLFQVAVAGSPVTDWRQYDSIYTERYMRTPVENEKGYDEGSCMTHAANLRGHLLIQQGMIDNNVHPNNTWQLVQALRKAGRTFDVSFYPDRDHRLGLQAEAERIAYLQEHLGAATPQEVEAAPSSEPVPESVPPVVTHETAGAQQGPP